VGGERFNPKPKKVFTEAKDLSAEREKDSVKKNGVRIS